jgi:hypothetical protein
MESFNRALHDFGEKFGLPDIVADANGLCTLRFDEKFTVQMQYDANHDRLTFFTRVGQIPAHAKLAAYEKLLQGNLFWIGTDGATLSVEPQDGTVFLARQLPLDGFSCEVLEQQLKTLVDTAELWAEDLARLHETAKVVRPADGQDHLRV